MKPLILSLITVAFLLVSQNAQAQDVYVDEDSGAQERFESALSNSLDRLKILLRRNPSRLRNVNESIKNTIEAANLLIRGRERERALELSRSAAKKYSDNVLAYLIQGELYESSGNSKEATQAWLNFLKKSSRAPWIARETLSWEDRRDFFEYTTGKLKKYGIEAPKNTNAERIPLIQKIAWEEGNKLREIITVGLPLIVCAGLIYYFFLIVMGADLFIERKNRIILQFYLLFIGLYAIWILHLFANLPQIIDPVEAEIFLMFLAGSILIASTHIFQIALARRKELSDPSTTACPHCRELIAKIVAECPFCREKL